MAYATIEKIVHTPAGREPGIGNDQNEVCQSALGVRLASLFLNGFHKRHAHGAQKEHPMSQPWPKRCPTFSVT